VFKNVHPVDIGAAVVKEVVARTGINRELIDEVIVGNAGMPADAANIARVIALRAGLPERIPAYSVQRNCASGAGGCERLYRSREYDGYRHCCRRRVHVRTTI
jgi:acetyl-CoA acetyltransferase